MFCLLIGPFKVTRNSRNDGYRNVMKSVNDNKIILVGIEIKIKIVKLKS